MSKKVEEWSVAKRYNPFNSYKLLGQIYKWRLIKRGNPLPQPTLVTVDLQNLCDLKCIWCNSDYILKRRHQKISKKTLFEIADFLKKWLGTHHWEEGVEAVCIAGGGEALLHPDIGKFIHRLVNNGIEVGIVTNGTHLNKNLNALSKCTWIGVSVDAGTPETFKKIKGKDKFDVVINNMRHLIEYSKYHNARLSMDRPGYGLTYKYLLHPYNVNEIVQAVKIAKEIGCKNFHLRPMGIPWDKLKDSDTDTVFKSVDIKTFNRQIKEARKYESPLFGVYGITHKFGDKLNIANIFSKCYAVFMTCAIMPATDGNNDHVTVGLCCDRRGDERLELATNLDDINKLAEVWGSEKHWEIFDNIDIKTCPRCTYSEHSHIFEHVILQDSMTYKFI